MEQSKNEQTNTPPYVAYRTLKNFLRSLSQAIPSRIDKSVMPSMAGGVRSQLLQALKYLNLIEANGAPKEKLPMLVKSEGAEYQKILREVLNAAYPFLKSKEIDLNTATMNLLDEQFSKLATGGTVQKCITFFIPAAKDAGIPLSPFIKEPGKRTLSNNRPKKPRIKPGAHTEGQGTTNSEATSSQPLSWHELLLSKFPSFDPSWPDEVKANWFISFNELMQKGLDKKEK